MGEAWGLFFLAFLLLTVPAHFLAAAVLAAAVHELGHLAAVKLLGGQTGCFRAGPRGAVLEIGGLDPAREALAAAAGPMASFLLLGLGRVFPEIALCGLGQGLYNLLPTYPLDGGRILLRVLQRWRSRKEAARITACVSCFVIGVLLFGCILLRMPLAAIFFLPLLARNIACKEE